MQDERIGIGTAEEVAEQIRALRTENARLRKAIETHRLQRGPFAVWKGDRKLWAALDEGGSQ